MKICMIGSGYVGLVSGACFAELGNNVICVDNNSNKISKLKNGEIPIYEPGLEELVKRNLKQKRLQFSKNISESIKKSDLIFICVGTPTKLKSNEADLKHVYQVLKDIKKNLNKYKIIVTKSTVPVTTGDKIQKLLTTKKNKKLFDVVSNPEFLREGEAIRDFMFPDRVIIGTNSKKANNVLKNLYSPIIKKKGRYFNTSRRAAEVIKYTANAFLAAKITFINEISNLCEKLNVDVTDVSVGIGADERIGGRFLRAGPGYGGSCFPKDTRALVSTSKKFKTNLSIVKSTIYSNETRYKYLLTKIREILNNNLKNKKITFLGVTFKAGTDDMRESASLKLIPYLIKKGSKVSYYEPTGIKNDFDKKKVTYFNNIKDACKNSDLLIIHTEWNEFKQLNFNRLNNKKKFKIYDLRNLYSPSKMKNKNIDYYSIGR
ncbi:UDP-glucose/GDP-mannose dehydrogenase family protein [Pelagibacterales bacterium SAG-MED23]|nr:UDP-glucose/GDP-mannose dehydrogenase family protein [Pelagibacterales bacterium SAG-MED23]